MSRENMKLVRLERRTVSAEAKMGAAIGTSSFKHREKIFNQRLKLWRRAQGASHATR